MSNYLIDDRPITFLPMLAKALGSCERAIVLQQIHWLSRSPNSGVWADDKHWIYGSYEEWCKDYFTMWSPHTLAKHIRNLEKMGVLISAQLMAHEHDRTKYYRIDYDALDSILPDPVVSEPPKAVVSRRPRMVASNAPDPVASIYRTETTTKNTADSKKRATRTPSFDEQKPRNYRPPEYADVILGHSYEQD